MAQTPKVALNCHCVMDGLGPISHASSDENKHAKETPFFYNLIVSSVK